MNDSRKCSPNADDKFGPPVSGCRHDFDFTLLFEQSILSLAPIALLMLLSVPRLIQLRRRSPKTIPTPLRHGKNVRIPPF